MPGLRKTLSRSTRPSQRRPGFTLVELLVVIGIIAVLMGILMPSLGKAREQANRIKCLANLKQIGSAMFMYANEHKDRLPNGNPLSTPLDYDAINVVLVALNDRYLKSPATFHCPSDRDPVQDQIVTGDQSLPNSARASYDFYSIYWLPEQGPKLARLPYAPLAWDLNGGDPALTHGDRNHRPDKPEGGNVVFGDGHGEWLVVSAWDGPNWPSPADKYYPPAP
jgi:prepilin-type N-terminal cleavage/methylation domain-containing protein/prepilin-type processing-associated H-X9-DG protein